MRFRYFILGLLTFVQLAHAGDDSLSIPKHPIKLFVDPLGVVSELPVEEEAVSDVHGNLTILTKQGRHLLLYSKLFGEDWTHHTLWQEGVSDTITSHKLVIDTFGNLTLIWSVKHNSQDFELLSISKPVGKAWQPVEVIPNTPVSYFIGALNATTDREGNVILFWTEKDTEESDYRIRAAIKPLSESWKEFADVPPAYSILGDCLEVYATPYNELLLLWKNEAGEFETIVKNEQGTWGYPVAVAPANSSLKMVMDVRGGFLAVWKTENQILSRERIPGNDWLAETKIVGPFSPIMVNYPLKVSINDNGDAVVAWEWLTPFKEKITTETRVRYLVASKVLYASTKKSGGDWESEFVYGAEYSTLASEDPEYHNAGLKRSELMDKFKGNPLPISQISGVVDPLGKVTISWREIRKERYKDSFKTYPVVAVASKTKELDKPLKELDKPL